LLFLGGGGGWSHGSQLRPQVLVHLWIVFYQLVSLPNRVIIDGNLTMSGSSNTTPISTTDTCHTDDTKSASAATTGAGAPTVTPGSPTQSAKDVELITELHTCDVMRLEGKVVEGFKRGSKLLGFPTGMSIMILYDMIMICYIVCCVLCVHRSSLWPHTHTRRFYEATSSDRDNSIHQCHGPLVFELGICLCCILLPSVPLTLS
jgi:hypothetical protein